MAKRGLTVPTLSAIQDRNIQAAFQSVMIWARNVDDNYVARDELRLPTAQSIQHVVKATMRQGIATSATAAKSAAAVNDQNRKVAAQIVRGILENSGTEKPIDMVAPVLFRATNSVTRTYIGAGGIGGAVIDAGDPRGYIPTWGFDSSDGSTFLGKDTVPAKQITFDATAGELTIGADVRINIAGYPTLSETYDTASLAYSNASSALSGLTAKLNKSGTDTLSGAISFVSSGALKIATGTLNVASDGTVSGSGSGVLLTQKGIVHVDAGTITMSLPITGKPVFGGDLSAAGGSFAGTLDVSSYIAMMRNGVEAGRLRAYAVGGTYGVGLYSNKNLDFRCEYTVGSEASTGQIVLTGSEHVFLLGGDTYGNYLKVSDSGVVFGGPLKSASGTAVSMVGHTLSDIGTSDTGYKFQFSTDGGATWSNIHLRRKDW